MLESVVPLKGLDTWDCPLPGVTPGRRQMQMPGWRLAGIKGRLGKCIVQLSSEPAVTGVKSMLPSTVKVFV